MAAYRYAEFHRLEAEIFSIALSVGNVVYINMEQLEADYMDLNGRPIPYRDYNFSSLRDMLTSMDKIMLVDYDEQGTVVIPVSNSQTRHLERLIEKQRQKQYKPTRLGGLVSGLDNKKTVLSKKISASRLSRAKLRRNTTKADDNVLPTNHNSIVNVISTSAMGDNSKVENSIVQSAHNLIASEDPAILSFEPVVKINTCQKFIAGIFK